MVANMREVQNILALLGMNVKLCPKLSSKQTEKVAVYAAAVVMDKILEKVQNYSDRLNKKKSPAKKNRSQKTATKVESSSSAKFLQSGLLQDSKGNVVQCTAEGIVKESALLKKSASEGERSPIMQDDHSKMSFEPSLPKDTVCKSKKELHTCSDCAKSFKQESTLRRHKERFHEGKTYGCGVCDQVCAYKRNLVIHCNSEGHDKDKIHVIVDLPLP